MKKKLFILTIACFVFASSLVFQTVPAQAVTDDISTAELHQLVMTLTNRVGVLEAELKNEKAAVATLQKQMTALKSGTAVATIPVKTVTQTQTGGVGICQDGKTLFVNVVYAIEQVQKNNAQMGVCTQQRTTANNSLEYDDLQIPAEMTFDPDQEDNTIFDDYEAY